MNRPTKKHLRKRATHYMPIPDLPLRLRRQRGTAYHEAAHYVSFKHHGQGPADWITIEPHTRVDGVSASRGLVAGTAVSASRDMVGGTVAFPPACNHDPALEFFDLIDRAVGLIAEARACGEKPDQMPGCGSDEIYMLWLVRYPGREIDRMAKRLLRSGSIGRRP